MSLTTRAPLEVTSTAAPPRIEAPTPRRRRVASRVYLPACAIAALAATLVGVGWVTHWGGANFTQTLTSLRVVMIGPASLIVIGALLVAERVWPAQRRTPLARGYRQDVLYTILNATVTLPLVAALSLSFAAVVRTKLHWLTFSMIGPLPRGVTLAAILILMDGGNWLAHLANHRVQVLWRFHELHHSQEDMNVLTVFRTHPLVHVAYLVALIPAVVLLANGVIPTTLLVVYGGWVALAHSNIRLTFGPLGRVLVSPNYHRIHHRLEGRQDVNLGFALTVWDQLFKTAVFPSSATTGIATGLPGRPLIVEQAGARPRHLSVFTRQLLAPFRPLRQDSPDSSAPGQ